MWWWLCAMALAQSAGGDTRASNHQRVPGKVVRVTEDQITLRVRGDDRTWVLLDGWETPDGARGQVGRGAILAKPGAGRRLALGVEIRGEVFMAIDVDGDGDGVPTAQDACPRDGRPVGPDGCPRRRSLEPSRADAAEASPSTPDASSPERVRPSPEEAEPQPPSPPGPPPDGASLREAPPCDAARAAGAHIDVLSALPDGTSWRGGVVDGGVWMLERVVAASHLDFQRVEDYYAEMKPLEACFAGWEEVGERALADERGPGTPASESWTWVGPRYGAQWLLVHGDHGGLYLVVGRTR